MKQKRIPIIYLCIHKKLCDIAGFGREVNRKKALEILGELYHIPKPLRSKVLIELKEIKIVSQVTSTSILLAEPPSEQLF